MQTLKSSLPRINRHYSPEEVQRALRLKDRQLAEQFGMCRPDCPLCAGVGWIRKGDGSVELCPNVDRWKLKSAARLGITKDEADELSWADIKLRNESLSAAVQKVRLALSQGYGWVYLYGSFGIGKTLILKNAIAESLRLGKDAAYVRMVEILDHLRDTFNETTAESESARLDWWSALTILAIDEFDKVRSTPYGDERRFVLMDRRYEAAVRQSCLTIISSNEPPDSLPGYLCDRVSDGRFVVVQIQGESFRPGMEWKS